MPTQQQERKQSNRQRHTNRKSTNHSGGVARSRGHREQRVTETGENGEQHADDENFHCDAPVDSARAFSSASSRRMVATSMPMAAVIISSSATIKNTRPPARR